MKCPACQTENKDNVTACKKCGADFRQAEFWRPTWRWHGRVLLTIYVVLIGVYFGLSALLKRLPEPYRMRKVPADITPWLKK